AGESRIALVRRGAVRLEPEGADLGVGDLATFDAARRLMVIEDGARPRVIADDAGVRLLLYVDRADARPILVAAAPLRSRPGASVGDPPRGGHVAVEPGAWVDVEARKPGAAKIRYRDEDVDFHGWVPADALGTTFTRHERPPPDPDTVWIAR